MKPTQEELEEIAKSAQRSHRMNQFLWGWSWAWTVVLGTDLLAGRAMFGSMWVPLVLFVVNALIATDAGRKLKAVKMTVSIK